MIVSLSLVAAAVTVRALEPRGEEAASEKSIGDPGPLPCPCQGDSRPDEPTGDRGWFSAPALQAIGPVRTSLAPLLFWLCQKKKTLLLFWRASRHEVSRQEVEESIQISTSLKKNYSMIQR